MFHMANHGTAPFMRYLLCTVACGGALGISHGVSASANRRELRPAAILHDGLAGAIAGPWAPVFVPLMLIGMWPSKCPYIHRKQNKPQE